MGTRGDGSCPQYRPLAPPVGVAPEGANPFSSLCQLIWEDYSCAPFSTGFLPAGPVSYPRSVGSDRGMVRYRVDTSSSTPVKSAAESLPVTDSSMEGWDAFLSGTDVKDVWKGSHRSLHFIHLEMLAARLALQHYKSEIQPRILLFFATLLLWGVFCRRWKELDLEISASSRGNFFRSARLGRLACLSDTFRLVRMC